MNGARPLDVYLNDHLAGSTGGVELAQRAAADYSDRELGEFFSNLVTEIQEDKSALEDVMKQVGTQPNPLKQAGAWVMEKVSRLKLTTLKGGELDALLTIETLQLGIQGKQALWLSLREVRDSIPELGSTDLDRLISRAEDQINRLETERLNAARTALVKSSGVS